MNLSSMPRDEFERLVGYITNLCGYPAVTSDKMNVLIDFLRVNHGHNTSDELTDAYRALASARLEEKIDNFKSLTGMSASRVIQAYMRTRKNKESNLPKNDSGYLTDDSREVIRGYNGRNVMYNHEVSDDERKVLMRHWIGKQQENYSELKRADLLTASSFVFLENEGTLRVKNGMLQKFQDNLYQDLCPWATVEDRGKRLVASESIMMSNARETSFRRMMSPSAGGSVEDGIRRMAVAIYFDSLIN